MATHFSDEEVAGLVPELVIMLDRARGFAGVPFIITSGLRTQEENLVAGGEEDSAHLYGEAVDLACSTSWLRHKMLPALYVAGFRRIGVYDRHLHADISTHLPQGVTWWGKSKGGQP